MEDKERQTLDLEEIMKEFHGDQDQQEAEELENLPQDFRDFLHLDGESEEELPLQEDAPEENSLPVTENAAHITEPDESQMTGDTIRLDRIVIDPNDVSIPDADYAPQVFQEDPPLQEAFTTSWEPEYEQPMGEYVAPQPIVFQPRSRLRELKRKLVAGPEKRYYALSERGVGKLQAALFFALLVSLLCIGATVMYTAGLVQPNRLRLMVFIQFFGLLLCALLGSFQMIEGVADLFKKRLTANTLLVVSFLVCCVDGVFCLQQQRIPCCGAFSLQVIMSLWSTYHRRVTEMGQMDTLRKAVRLDSLSACPDYYEGVTGLIRGEGQVEDFMDHYREPSKQERILYWYCLGAIAAAAAIGVTAGLFNDLYVGIQVAAVSLLAAAPATLFITLTRPYAILEKRLHKLGTVLCGWSAIHQLKDAVVFPLTHQDIYPAGSVRLNGVKFFGERNTDDVVAYCAALVNAAGSGLAPLFQQLLEGRNGIHYTPDEVQPEEGGIVGRIDDEDVLVGSLSFMNRMGIEIPEGAKVPYAVCIAIQGQFCGLFAISYDKVRDSAAGMTTLSAYRKLHSVITGSDFVLTESFIRNRFGIKTKRILFPETDVRRQLQETTAGEDAAALLLVTSFGLSPYAYGVTGAKALWRSNTLGLIVHMVGGILGLGIMLTLVLLGALDLLSPANVLAYHLVWMIPGLLITEWTRSV